MVFIWIYWIVLMTSSLFFDTIVNIFVSIVTWRLDFFYVNRKISWLIFSISALTTPSISGRLVSFDEKLSFLWNVSNLIITKNLWFSLNIQEKIPWSIKLSFETTTDDRQKKTKIKLTNNANKRTLAKRCRLDWDDQKTYHPIGSLKFSI